jgi:hypothetical protein
MKLKSILNIILIITCWTVTAQSEYSRVKIDLLKTSIKALHHAGVCIDHADIKRGVYIKADLSAQEIHQLDLHNITYEIAIDDLKDFYKQQIKQHSHANRVDMESTCHQKEKFTTPDHFQLGSMGGYFTYAEYLSHVDSMVKTFPHLILGPDTLDSLTIEGRPILSFVISDQDEDSTEPRILYNALHHAREPASLSGLIFYMWYLLENYETNAEIKYLVDHTQLFFVPCVNPDGYIYNQTTEPEGGGLWRKNRRDNGSNYGVDLNRNYGGHWGYDDQGSSASSASETYRGSGPFSEPETQSIKALCIKENFSISLNYHTYGNLLIYPWGYDYNIYTPDSMEFAEMAKLMTQDNSFVYGTGNQTVGYITNGDSDDWMYGNTEEKAKIFSMTPELGPRSYGFWPPEDEIIPICKTGMNQNLKAAHMLLSYPVYYDQSNTYCYNNEGFFKYQIKSFGLNSNSSYDVSFLPITANISFEDSMINFDDLSAFEAVFDSIEYQLNTTDLEELIKFEVLLDNGLFIQRDTIEKHYVRNFIAFYDDGTSMDNWSVSGGDWGIKDGSIHSNPNTTLYSTNENMRLSLSEPIKLRESTSAYLSLNMSWDLEANFDYLQIEVSTDNLNWNPLCGKFTKSGGQNQDDHMPLYDGSSNGYLHEEISLNAYTGNNIYIRFYINSDYEVSAKGLAIDDILIAAVGDSTIYINEIENGFYLSQNYPNPSENACFINYAIEMEEPCYFLLYDQLGRLVRKDLLDGKFGHIRLDTKHLDAGMYQYQIQGSNASSEVKKMIIQ